VKVVVTGGAGFIGSNLVDRLVNDGHDVIVIDNESTDAHENFYYNDKAHYYPWDIGAVGPGYDLIETLFKGVDYVFHLAAEARIQPTIEDPVLAVKTNVLGTCNVLQASRKNGVKRVIYSSTSSAYGLANSIPNKEDMPKDCLTPYSVSKTSGEELCQTYTKLFGLETVVFRYFNVYGERQPTKGQYAPVIGLFQRQHSEEKPMTIVGDGFQRRDFTHVSDVVEANILAAETDKSEVFGEIINIGFGASYNIHDIVKFIGGEDAEFIHIPERPGESRETLSDCSKARSLLQWEPMVKLEEWIVSCKQLDKSGGF
jgi:UDP-glucose 4-epimerase